MTNARKVWQRSGGPEDRGEHSYYVAQDGLGYSTQSITIKTVTRLVHFLVQVGFEMDAVAGRT